MDIDEILSEIEAVRNQGYEQYVTVDGIRIRYMVRGSGHPVLLIHGFGGFLETWAFNIPPLSRRYRVYALDLPGHGLSDKPKSGYTTAFAIEHARGIMKALDIERTILVGHSLGGAVSINIALSLPERVSRLVLVDSAGLTSRMPWLYRLSALPVLGSMLMSLAVGPALERSNKKLFYNAPVLPPDMLETLQTNTYRTRAKKTLLEIVRQNMGIRGPRPETVLVDKLPQLTMPTLFVHGAQDRIFPLGYVQESFSLAPDSRVKIFDPCGHCPHIEKAVEFNETVTSFLDGG
jgi:pimeloyl-ACP methyl ester carboxylesterase